MANGKLQTGQLSALSSPLSPLFPCSLVPLSPPPLPVCSPATPARVCRFSLARRPKNSALMCDARRVTQLVTSQHAAPAYVCSALSWLRALVRPELSPTGQLKAVSARPPRSESWASPACPTDRRQVQRILRLRVFVLWSLCCRVASAHKVGKRNGIREHETNRWGRGVPGRFY